MGGDVGNRTRCTKVPKARRSIQPSPKIEAPVAAGVFLFHASSLPISNSFTSLSRNPALRLRPGSLIRLSFPSAASRSTTRKQQASRRATSARRKSRGGASDAGAGDGFVSPLLRSEAIKRARSLGVTVGSAFRPAFSTSIVVGSIVFAFVPAHYAPLCCRYCRQVGRKVQEWAGTLSLYRGRVLERAAF